MASGKRKDDTGGLNDGPRILVVDDDEATRELLSVKLEEAGYQPTTAESAEIALELFAHDPYPLVISDIRMSGIDGIDLLKLINKWNEDTQVIMITGHASLKTSLESLREGAYDYLLKPIVDFDIVLVAVERALEKVRLVIENRYLFEKLQNSNKELESAGNALREITLRDGLTGLYNQRYLKEAIFMELKRATRHNRSLSMLFVDVDHFKKYNDTHGHMSGDDVLEKFAKLLQQRLRLTDIASRYGGEEFVLLLPETSKANAILLANDICQLIHDTAFPNEQTQPEGKLTASIGVSTFPDDGSTEDELLTTADKALYQAKEKGRDQVFFFETS